MQLKDLAIWDPYTMLGGRTALVCLCVNLAEWLLEITEEIRFTWQRECYEFLETQPKFCVAFAAGRRRALAARDLWKTPCGVGYYYPEEEAVMEEKPVRLGPREQQIAELLLQGCDNTEIAAQLKMARRTVKAHFNRLFLRFGIDGGIKRVKLATTLYRRQLCLEESATENGSPTNASSELSNSSPKGSKTVKSQKPSARLSMS
jgi:DNA-binding CsgD family transcriptional regulator